MDHTYLFQPGLWSVEGSFYDRQEGRHRQSGQLAVIHEPDLWTIDSQINVSGQDVRDFLTRYEVTPFKPGAAHTEWKSLSGGPEPIFGLFVVVEDCLMMPWQSRSGLYWGQEVLARLGPDEYLSRGFAFIKDEKASSWAVKLTRQGAAEEAPEGEGQ
ncbi:MAG: hypothetical protein LBU12_00255 [Deltaproteobacteria bacterium]|nr:hypothetical protein [Deltaproteobacteria bacterium]